MEKSKNISRFRYWYELMKDYGEDGRKLMEIEHRFWRYFWARKNIFRYQTKHIKKMGKFKLIPEYTKDEETKQLSMYGSSFLKGKDRELSLYRHIMFLQRNEDSIVFNILKYLGVENSQNILGIFLTGSVFFGPRKENFDKDSDIDLFCLLNSKEFNDKKLQFKEPSTFYIQGEKKKIQVFFVGEKINEKPGFLPIHFLATPNFQIINFKNKKKITDIEKQVISETINELDDLEKLVLSFEKSLEEIKKEIILE